MSDFVECLCVEKGEVRNISMIIIYNRQQINKTRAVSYSLLPRFA